MKVRIVNLFLLLLFSTTSCASRNDLEPEFEFTTTEGKIVVKLYAETPQHRDNFVKLVEAGFYDGLLFHRVIADFMIQAGDPESKNAPKNKDLGSGDVGYTIPAEIIYPKYYHKKGALAAARQPDETNPEKASSGAQFYFVKGRVFTSKQLDELETKRAEDYEAKLFDEIRQKNIAIEHSYRKARNQEKVVAFRDSILMLVHEQMKLQPKHIYTEQQRAEYTTLGGTPHLDGAYTVFGEVIKGVDIVSNISKVKTNKMDRPNENIRILKVKRLR